MSSLSFCGKSDHNTDDKQMTNSTPKLSVLLVFHFGISTIFYILCHLTHILHVIMRLWSLFGVGMLLFPVNLQKNSSYMSL